MSEPTYGSGQYDPQQGYGQQGGVRRPAVRGAAARAAAVPVRAAARVRPAAGTATAGARRTGSSGAGYGGSGYPSSGAPSTPKPPQDKLALAATLLTIVGYVCAGAGVLGFILWLAADGDGISRFATALGTLVTGLGLGGLNYGLGTWLGERRTSSS